MTEFTQGIHGAARRIYDNNKGLISYSWRGSREKLDCKKVPQDTDSAILGSLSVFHQGILTFINQKLTPDKIILTGGKASNLLPYFNEAFFSKSLLDHRPNFIHEALFQVLQDYNSQ